MNGYTRRQRSSASTSPSSIRAEDVAAGKCERELEIALAEGRFEEEGWRAPQGRRRGSGRTWSSRRSGTRRESRRLRKGDPRPDGTAARRRGAQAKRGTAPAADRLREGLRHLRPRSDRARGDLESRRRTAEGLFGGRRSSASTSRASTRKRTCARGSARWSWRGRRGSAVSRTRAGACARTARASGPMS